MTANLAVLVEQMQVALDAIAEAVVFCNADNQVQWCNAAFEQLVNLPNSSIIGHKLTKVLPLRKSGKKVAQTSYPSIKVLRGCYEITDYEFRRCGEKETRFLRETGFLGEQRAQLRLQISGSCVVVGDESTCVLTIRNVTEGVGRDISDRKQAEQALKASEAKLNMILSSALGAVSHYRNCCRLYWCRCNAVC